MSTQPNSKRFKKLRQQLSRASNEEEVRLAWVRALEAALGITFDAERGNRDLSYNNVVIEFKGPRKFNGKVTSPAFQEACTSACCSTFAGRLERSTSMKATILALRSMTAT